MELDWERIANGLRTGRYNLLLGAGVSLDSRSGSTDPLYEGQLLPSAGQLREELTTIIPNIKAGSSLSRLYKNLTSEQVERHITARFTNCIPGDTVKRIPDFRWKRIFTLNIDDALEAAYRTARCPAQQPLTINFRDPYSDTQDKQYVQIIHLHGYTVRYNDSYVFDIKEYMKTISDNSIWAHILGNIIRSEPFFVLGASLEEPDIAYFIADRDPANERADRAPSILVEPFPDAGTETDCIEYALSLYHGTALDFLNLIDERTPNRPSIFDIVQANLGDISESIPDTALLSFFHSYFERVPTTHQPYSRGAANFALGHEASWGDIQADCDIAREGVTNTFRASVDLKSNKQIYLLLGEPGAGKTTILKRVALDLAQTAVTCLWRRAPGRIQLEQATIAVKALNRPIVIFVDNFADYAQEIFEWRKMLIDTNIIFIGAERYYRYEHIRRIIGVESLKISKVGVTGESAAVNLIRSYISLGLSETKKEDEVKFSRLIAHEPMAVACCRIINNYDPIERVIDRCFSDANGEARRCYLIVALAAHCLRDGIDYDVLSGIVKGYSVEAQIDGHSPLPVQFRDVGEFEMIVPLNEVIAEGILKKASSTRHDLLFRVFNDVAKAIRPYVNLTSIRAGHPSARLASRLFDYDEIVKDLLGQSSAEFYDTAKKDWGWNSRYWHQIALMRLDMAATEKDKIKKKMLCELAVQHARHAKTIEARHQFTLTTIGKVLFGKMDMLNELSTSNLDEAIEALSQAALIERSKNRLSVHPFLVLFDGIISLSRLGAIYSFSQRQKLTELSRQAVESFPSREDIKKQAQKAQSLL